MNKISLTALALLAVSAFGGGAYYYLNQTRASADSVTQTLAEPDKGMVVEVVAADGKTKIANAKLAVVVANVGNTSVRNVFGINAADYNSMKSRINSASVSTNDAVSSIPLEGNNNLLQNPLTEQGRGWFDTNAGAINGLAWYTNNESTYEQTSPSMAIHNGKYYYPETYLKTDKAGNVNPAWIPIRVYASFGDNNQYMEVVDLLKANTTGAQIADYKYGSQSEMKNGKLYVTVQLPVTTLLAGEAIKGDPAVVIQAQDLEGNAINNAVVSFNIYAAGRWHRPKNNRTLWQWGGTNPVPVAFEKTTGSDGKVVLTSEEVTRILKSEFSKVSWWDRSSVTFQNEIDMKNIYIDYSVKYGKNIIPTKVTYSRTIQGSWYGSRNITYVLGPVNLASDGDRVADVVFLDTELPGAKRAIALSADKTSYKVGEEIKASLTILSGDKDLQILRRTMAEAKVTLSNYFDSVSAFNYGQTAEKPLGEAGISTSDLKATVKAGTEKAYAVTLKIPATVKPGVYKLSGEIFGLPYGLNKVIEPVNITILTK